MRFGTSVITRWLMTSAAPGVNSGAPGQFRRQRKDRRPARLRRPHKFAGRLGTGAADEQFPPDVAVGGRNRSPAPQPSFSPPSAARRKIPTPPPATSGHRGARPSVARPATSPPRPRRCLSPAMDHPGCSRGSAWFASGFNNSQHLGGGAGMFRVMREFRLVDRPALDKISPVLDLPAQRRIGRQQQRPFELKLLHDRFHLGRHLAAQNRIHLLVNPLRPGRAQQFRRRRRAPARLHRIRTNGNPCPRKPAPPRRWVRRAPRFPRAIRGATPPRRVRRPRSNHRQSLQS